MKKLALCLFVLSFLNMLKIYAQENLAKDVNVFLGTSGDHGQLSPGATSPFHQLDIAPQTYPHLHAGYEHDAKEILGFTHNRFEGVGCMGSGGLIFVKPFLKDEHQKLFKSNEKAGPGFYEVRLNAAIQAKIAVSNDFGLHNYSFQSSGDIQPGLMIDLGFALNNGFVSNDVHINEHNLVFGSIRAKTTCAVGEYTLYFALQLPEGKISKSGNIIRFYPNDKKHLRMEVAISAVNSSFAIRKLQKNISYAQLKKNSTQQWNTFLNSVQVKGDPARKKLFYSLLYRTMQSPFQISERDSVSPTTGGQTQLVKSPRYHGWAIWDNFKTQLPLISILNPSLYGHFVQSVADLYKFGKYDFAGPNEPANSVRTEHASVLLLDGLKKGHQVNLSEIKAGLLKDTVNFDYNKPDKFLEACYDWWTLGKLFPQDSAYYFQRALRYKSVWNKEFKDLTRNDVDRMSARNMYQGTIRQYRWNIPFDMKGLTQLIGGKKELAVQLNDFFDNSFFNRANEPDIQSPTAYYASAEPSAYQALVHHLAVDTVVQYYFNDNSRGIDPFIDRIYKNEPKAYIRTMDDDGGAMSAWFVMTAMGLQQPLVGEPVYYLNVPLFREVKINNRGKIFQIKVRHFGDKNDYLHDVKLNNKPLNRLWITHQEIMDGGILEITAGDTPSSFGTGNIWISTLN